MRASSLMLLFVSIGASPVLAATTFPIAVGDTYNGSFTYDASVPDHEAYASDPTFGVYRHNSAAFARGFSLEINGLVFQHYPEPLVENRLGSAYPDTVTLDVNTYNTPANDYIDVMANRAVLPDGWSNTLDSYPSFPQLSFRLWDNTGVALNNDSLPTSLDLDDWHDWPSTRFAFVTAGTLDWGTGSTVGDPYLAFTGSIDTLQPVSPAVTGSVAYNFTGTVRELHMPPRSFQRSN